MGTFVRSCGCLENPTRFQTIMVTIYPDRGKWLAAKVLQENSDVITNSGSISLPCIPLNGWYVFPSQNIPSLFNYGHVHYYVSF